MTSVTYIRGDVKYSGREDQEDACSSEKRSNTRHDYRNGYGNLKERRGLTREEEGAASGQTKSQQRTYIRAFPPSNSLLSA